LQTEEQKPIRFTDSASAFGHASSSSGYGHSAPPLSSTSGLGTTATHASTYASTPAPSPRRSSAASAADHLADLYHNYRDNFQPALERDRDRDRDFYYRAEPYYDRTAEYVVKHPYCGYDECSFEYREPAADPRAGPLAHRRTPSDSSAGNSHADEFSPARHRGKERREEYNAARAEYPRKASDYSLPRDYYRGEGEREAERQQLALELGPARLRSSLKKQRRAGAPTPPDSAAHSPASDTDSFASARDASSGSASRVRFSPDAAPDRHS
jgi:hypothetical protein